MHTKRFHAGILVILAAVFACVSPGYADYRFDDLMGPSGISYQWMILNNSGFTFGDSHSTAIDVSGDMVSGSEALLEVLSGKAESPIYDNSLNTFFLVTANGLGEFTMNFRSPTLQQFNPVTPNLQLSTPWNENLTINEAYTDTKTALGQPDGNYDALWRSYNFQVTRNDTETYNTVAQYFYFHQNPRDTSSQGIPRPFVISNVHPGTASDAPLELRLTLRDSNSNSGNIVAYDSDLWAMEDSMIMGGDDWVFVPVQDFNSKNATYYLTTEVANHCAVRYAALPYTNYGSWQSPSKWKFDLPRVQGTTNIFREFDLAPESHIAPGLVTIYRRPYQLSEADKRPLRLFPIDDTRGTGVYDLILNHRLVYGKRLGETYKETGDGGVSMFEITAFEFQPASMNFLDNVARVTGSYSSVVMPSTQIFTGASIKRDTTSIPSTALQYFTIEQNIPATLRTSGKEAMLPLHITFNIPVTSLGADAWNDVLRAWRQNRGRIVEAFADYYHIYLLAETNGEKRLWNLTQEMDKYPGQLKVFLDEDRGRITRDNDRGVITVSFIAMLMDGTRDGERPELSVVPDSTNLNSAEYIVMRDGELDNKWKMTFFIAPANYAINEEPSPVPTNTPIANSSGGGGGCSAGMLGLVSAAVLLFIRKGDSF
ncbi:MAG: hypothetical protein IJR85_03605 [Synergistaceae bacterium]|nr:hypothetical protein [Synergistaceae bacterium]